ncbi:hypothetical protein G7068_13275 [Leucobacter viscericola]|uniref:Uncharacterized protein n=1 Tax=Leucobacter viscericola TaxID=2714935 RepID=A0A6G7XI51_9MICO|nr:hypothetical protein [Leucobacter viscericola]QIK64057.1 hypothetical protein G7068_13275 [Leucobacter viscericola]
MTNTDYSSQGAAIPAATAQPGRMSPGVAWSEEVAGWMLEGTRCPVCFATPLVQGCCTACASDLRGPAGAQLSQLSAVAADAIRARQMVLATVPRVAVPAVPVAPAMPVVPAVDSLPTNQNPAQTSYSPEQRFLPPVPTPAPASSASLQSVLAVAGAGLVAIAAIVFTFFNPDLSDKGLRSAIVGLTTLAFAGGASLLARRGLQFSAEAIGGLAVVFVGLDIWAFARWAPDGTNPWLLTAFATLVAAGCLALAGKWWGVRTWSFGAAVAVTLVPIMFAGSSNVWFAMPLGFVTMAFVGFGAAARVRAIVPRTALGSLTGLQIVAGLSAVGWAISEFSWGYNGVLIDLAACGVLAALAAHSALATRLQIPRVWSVTAGVLAAVSAGLFASTVVGEATRVLSGGAIFGRVPYASTGFVAVVFVIAVATLRIPLPKRVFRAQMTAGVLSVLGLSLAGPLVMSVLNIWEALIAPLWLVGAQQVGLGTSGILSAADSWPNIFSVSIAAVGCLYLSRTVRRRWSNRLAVIGLFTVLGVSFATIALLAMVSPPTGWVPGRLAIPLVAAAVWAVGVRWSPALRAKISDQSSQLRFAVHVLVIAAAIMSWRDPVVGLVTGVGVLVVLALVAQASSKERSWYVGFGYAYGLTLVAVALAQLNNIPGVDLSGALQLSVVTSLGLLVALAATIFRVCESRSWLAILLVTLVPFGLGIAQVVMERSGWTALSTGLMCALAFVLMVTRRPGLGGGARAVAAGMLAPSLSVFAVCLGAEVIPGSASPVILPIIAVVVGVALLLAKPTRGLLERRGIAVPIAQAASLAIEISALVTGAIAVMLSLMRQAAGLGTTLSVLLILGAAAAMTAKLAGRKYAWWVAGACLTGALWCVWGMTGVTLLEAYLLPPTLGAAGVAAVLTVRGKPAAHLYVGWLGLAIFPVLVRFTFNGSVARGFGLLGGALLLLAIGSWLRWVGRRAETRGGFAKLSEPTLLASMLAAVAGPVFGARFGIGADTLSPTGESMHGALLFFVCLAVAALASCVMAFAAGGMSTKSRWLGAPAVLALAVGVWPSIERDWFNIWAMWGMMCIGIVTMIVAARSAGESGSASPANRSRLARVADAFPPVWFVFLVTFLTAIVAWSPRDLRVEWFSLPLGIGLLAAGALAASKADSAGAADRAQPRGTLNDWPGRWVGSWATYAPGLIVTISASVIATFTDPQTWRAILVIVIALIAIVVGAARRLAAPFILGIIVLPVENVIAFAVQIGRGIESMPWWITLAIVGAVLLTIAVTYERRAGEAETLVARLRDLR